MRGRRSSVVGTVVLGIARSVNELVKGGGDSDVVSAVSLFVDGLCDVLKKGN